MTREAVIVVLFVVPSTSTDSPVVTPLAGAALVPCQYAVEALIWTVTVWPAEVVSTKPDADVLSTVPVEPPAAGPDRALVPPPPCTGWVAGAVRGDVAADAVLAVVLAVALRMP